jgi:phosphoribosylformylglycinamidine synthase
MKQPFDVQVRVWLKPSVFDPQGNAVESALKSLGFADAHRVRIGKYMELTVEAENQEAAEALVKEMCETVLCNPVMETYAFTVSQRKVDAAV